jgi:hypothetical protein
MGSKNPMFGRVGFCGIGEHNPMFGRVGVNHPAYGRKHSDEAKEKLSIAITKYNMNPEHRYQRSLLLMGKNKGKTHSDKTKLKMRIARLKRLEELGIPQKEDRGAKTFFDGINKMGYDFKPKRFINIGYDADGYDEQRHIWYEFDTPYHNVLGQKRKDFVRQTNIIRHFEEAGQPLTAFMRTKSDGMGNVIESTCVYKNGKHTDIILGFAETNVYL